MLYACIGSYATNPYYIEDMGVYIHSIEELCYYLRENITGLENGIMRAELCRFIENGLDMAELGRSLADIVRQGGSLARFVTRIFEAAGYCTKDEIAGIEKLLNDNALLKPGMKRKKRGDYFMSQGSFMKALREYEAALLEEGCDDDKDISSAIMHNIGCCYARMFYFDEAAKQFLSSFELSGKSETYEMYLAALRIGGSREKYVRQIVDLELDQEAVERLEGRIEKIASKSRESEEYSKLQQAIDDRNAGEISSYTERVKDILSHWKEEYRKNMEVD